MNSIDLSQLIMSTSAYLVPMSNRLLFSMHESERSNNKQEVVCLTTRWRRPGMRRDLPAKLYDWDAEIACDGSNPGASAQSR